MAEGEKADFVEDEKTHLGEVEQAPLERACRLLGAEVEQELRGGQKENRVATKHRAVHYVPRDHGLSEAAASNRTTCDARRTKPWSRVTRPGDDRSW
jgi:hypothetical protein